MPDDIILDGVRQKVFLDRYSLKDKDGNPTEQSPNQMWRRVARAVSLVEDLDDYGEVSIQEYWEKRFYDVLNDFKFVPGGRILAGAGTGTDVTYYNCFVLPCPEDSRHGIMQNLTEMVDIMARGGGVGVNMSSLRPKGAYIKTVNGHSSGPISWMELYSDATHRVIQQGGTRRGALMLMLDDWHPDIEDFINRKSEFVTDASGVKRPKYLEGANISVCTSDGFMDAVFNDGDWDLRFPDIDHPAYKTEWNGNIRDWEAKGYPVKIYKTIKARDLWDQICTSAWKSADPGLVFMERVQNLANSSYFEAILATNPCGEQPLGAYSVCLLGAMNLSAYVFGGNRTLPYFDFDAFQRDVKVAVRFLDNVIDVNKYFMAENEQVQKHDLRRMGLGTMGLADALIKLALRYGSEEANEVTDKIFTALRDAAYEASVELAQERGPFGKFDRDQYLERPFIQGLPDHIIEGIAEHGIRNCYLLTNAPTGSTSLITGVSSGIEPVFDFVMRRVDRTGESIIYHPLAQAWLEAHPGEKLPDFFVNAESLTPEEHVTVQAIAQRRIDSSISKTANAPNSHTVDQVKALYELAYKLGCKGVTYYRDGSRDAVLTHVREEQTDDPAQLIERPDFLEGATSRVKTPVGTAYVTINKGPDGRIYEVFVTVGKAGTDISADAEALGRMISIALRIPTNLSQDALIEEVIGQLDGIGGSGSTGFGPKRVRSLADGVAKVLKAYQTKSAIQAEVDEAPKPSSSNRDICPNCGSASLVREEGCSKCYTCGYSAC